MQVAADSPTSPPTCSQEENNKVDELIKKNRDLMVKCDSLSYLKYDLEGKVHSLSNSNRILTEQLAQEKELKEKLVCEKKKLIEQYRLCFDSNVKSDEHAMRLVKEIKQKETYIYCDDKAITDLGLALVSLLENEKEIISPSSSSVSAATAKASSLASKVGIGIYSSIVIDGQQQQQQQRQKRNCHEMDNENENENEQQKRTCSEMHTGNQQQQQLLNVKKRDNYYSFVKTINVKNPKTGEKTVLMVKSNLS